MANEKLEKLEEVLPGGDSDRYTCKATLNLEIKVYSNTSYSEVDFNDSKGKDGVYIGENHRDHKETEGVGLNEITQEVKPNIGRGRLAAANTVVIKRKNCKCNCHCVVF